MTFNSLILTEVHILQDTKNGVPYLQVFPPSVFTLGEGSEKPNEIPVLLVHPRSAVDTHVIISFLTEGQELSE